MKLFQIKSYQFQYAIKTFTNQLNHRTCKECVDVLNYLYISLLNQNQYSKPRCRPIFIKYLIHEHEQTINRSPHVNKLVTWFALFSKPMRKLSGLISRWINDLEWTNSTRVICQRRKTEPCFFKGLTNTNSCIILPTLVIKCMSQCLTHVGIEHYHKTLTLIIFN